MKSCTRCGTEKPLDEYHRDKRSSDGRVSRCKTCTLAYHVEYRARTETKERVTEYNRKYYAEHRETLLKLNAEYRAENRESLREQSAKYYVENREAVLARNAEYRTSPEVRPAVLLIAPRTGSGYSNAVVNTRLTIRTLCGGATQRDELETSDTRRLSMTSLKPMLSPRTETSAGIARRLHSRNSIISRPQYQGAGTT